MGRGVGRTHGGVRRLRKHISGQPWSISHRTPRGENGVREKYRRVLE